MSSDSSNGNGGDSTKRVDRAALNSALNQTVDKRELLSRVNAQVSEQVMNEGTAKVDRDSVARYLQAAKSGEFVADFSDSVEADAAPDPAAQPAQPVAAPAPAAPVVAAPAPAPVPAAPAVAPAPVAAPVAAAPAPVAPAPAVQPEPVQAQQPVAPIAPTPAGERSPLVGMVILAVVGVLVGILLAVGWVMMRG